MTSVKTPNEAINEYKAEVVKKNLSQVYDLEQAIERGLLKAHASGLEAAAALIAEVADDIAKVRRDREERKKATAVPASDLDKVNGDIDDAVVDAVDVAVSKTLADLNDRIMARIKNVSVMTNITQLG